MNRAFARSYDATKEKEPPPEPDLVLNSDEMELAQSILIMIESKDFFRCGVDMHVPGIAMMFT